MSGSIQEMLIKVMGTVTPVPRDAWMNDVIYQRLNIVTHNAKTYIAKKSSINVRPAIDDGWETYWMELLSGGSVSPDTPTRSEFDELKELVSDLTYKEPTTSLSLLGTVSTVDMTSDNLTRQVTGFTHKETNINNIEGQLMFTGKSTVVNVEKIDTLETFNLAVPINITFSSAGTRSVGFTLSGTSVKGKGFSASASITSYYPAFFGASLTSPDDLATLGEKTSTASINGTRNVTINGEAKYVWFCTTGTISKITSNGFDVPFEQDDTLNYKGGNYKLYRTSNLIVAGTHTFVIS